jgi:PIN domain nuclease of toxin-antitoxin system
MRLLPDTHTILWDFLDDPRLGQEAKRIIFSRQSSLWLSAASVWEIATKVSIGKLDLGQSLAEFLKQATERLKLRHLPVRAGHAVAISGMPLHHKDPFDRMLIAQAQFEGLTIVTADEAFSKYDVPILDARK